MVMENPDVEMELELKQETMTLKYKVHNEGEGNVRTKEFLILANTLFADGEEAGE